MEKINEQSLKSYRMMNMYCISLDFNECTISPCEHHCTNTNGSFVCTCNDEHELDNNGRTCTGTYV